MTLEERTELLVEAMGLIRELADPNMTGEPINQDEQGGCVWCGHGPPGQAYGYATSDSKDHHCCPWIEAMALLKRWDTLHPEPEEKSCP